MNQLSKKWLAATKGLTIGHVQHACGHWDDETHYVLTGSVPKVLAQEKRMQALPCRKCARPIALPFKIKRERVSAEEEQVIRAWSRLFTRAEIAQRLGIKLKRVAYVLDTQKR